MAQTGFICCFMYVDVCICNVITLELYYDVFMNPYFFIVIGYFFNTSGGQRKKKAYWNTSFSSFYFHHRMQVCLPLGPKHRQHGRGQSGPWPPGWGRWHPTRTHCGRRIHSLASGWWGRMLRPWRPGNGHPSGCKVSDWKERQTDRKITEGFCPPVTLIDV